MARKQERKYISFNLDKSPVIEENERLLSTPTTPQQTQTLVAPVAEATEQTEAAEPAEAAAPIEQPQQQVQQPQQQVQQPQQQVQQPQPQVQQPQPQVQQPQPQVQQQPIAQTAQSIGMTSAGNRSKRTEQGITVIVPMEYYEQIALMKMRTGIPIRDIALQAVIEFVDKHKND